VRSSSNGLVVAGSNNFIWSYEMKDLKEQRPNDVPVYYAQLHAKIGIDEKADSVKDNTIDLSIQSLAISLNEDHIYFIDNQN